MSWLVGFGLKFRLLVVAIAAGMMAFGITQLRSAPLDVLPEFTQPYVEIQTEALGLSAEEVQQMVTVPLEQDLLAGVAWVQHIRSESLPGLSSIRLTFEPGTDLMRGRQMVGERLTQAFALPHVSKPPTMLQPMSSTSRVMMVGLSSADMSLIDLSVLARWTVGPRLRGVPGVASVAIWGQRDRQLQVQVDPQHLAQQNVTLSQVLETTGNAMWVSSLSFVEASTPGTGGFIETSNQRLGVRHVFPISSPDDLAKVPVDGTSLRLGDVATVVEDHQPLIGDAVGQNGPSLLLVVDKLPGANTLEVTRGLEEALTAMRPGLAGIVIDSSIYRPASFIETAVFDLGRSVLIAGLLGILALGAFLLRWRTALICIVVIPVSLTAGLVVLHLRGASINTMVAAGFLIALGVVVDDAISTVDTITRRIREQRAHGGNVSSALVIMDATLEGGRAMIYATLVLLLAVVPVFILGGLAGPFFTPLAVSYTLAVLASLLVSLTLTPALSLLLLGHLPAERAAPAVMARLRAAYDRLLRSVFRAPQPLFIGTALALVLGLAMLPFVRQSLVPSFKESDLLVHLGASPGTSRQEMNRMVGRTSDELRALPGVRNVGAHVGRAVLGDQVVDVNASELWVSVDRSTNYDRTVADIARIVNGYPGLHHMVQTYLGEHTSDVVAVPDNAIVVRLYGENQADLRTNAEVVKQAMLGVKGVLAPEVKLPVQEPTLEIQVDLEKAQQNGLKPGDVRRASATLLSGIQAGSLFESQKVFDVVVWGSPETRNSLSSIRNLLIDTPSGGHVRLGDVAQVRIMPAATVIRHDAVKSYLDIRADVSGRRLPEVAGELEQSLQKMTLPLEYHAEVVGNYAARESLQARAAGFAIAALLLMFLLLQAAFGSWRLAALCGVLLPVSVVGGLLAVLVTGGIASLGSMVGMLAVYGLAVRQTFMLVKRYHDLGQHGGYAFGPDLVVRGAQERLGPTLMTAMVTGLMLLPFVVFASTPGHEIVGPMAIAMLGGLVTSTLVSALVMPAIYALLAAYPAPASAVPSVVLSPQPIAVSAAG